MASNEYQFLTTWRVLGTAEEVFELISHAEDFPRWWPSVYLNVEVLEPGRPGGVGKRVRLFTRGWLPYTLRWEFVATDVVRPERLVIAARGDFVGTGVWTFAERGDAVDVSFDWRVRADKPLLRSMSVMLKPVFAANHRWAMARGFESLELELRRRRANTPHELAQIPPPPKATFR